MPTHCPACKKAVPPDAEACPFCPMSFRDESLELPKGRSSESSLPTIAGLVLLAVVGFGAWQGLGWVLRAANPPDASAPAPEADQGEVKVELAEPARSKRLLKTAPPGEDAGTVTITPLPAEKPAAKRAVKPVREWRLRGNVYDLVTLAPVSLCPMVFSDIVGNARYETMTDAKGRYRVILPPLPGRGYTVMISREGYAANYLKPRGENVAGMSAERRRALAVRTARSLEGPAALAPEGSEPLLTDFYLAPTGGIGR